MIFEYTGNGVICVCVMDKLRSSEFRVSGMKEF